MMSEQNHDGGSSGSAEDVATRDLQAALTAAKDLIQSLREYSKNLANDLDEAKGQVDLLKERLHESAKAPDEDKAEQRKKLQQWLKEAAAEKEVQMQTAMLAVENRNLKYELDALKTGVATTPKKKTGRAAAEPASRPSLGASVLFVLGGVVVGAMTTRWLSK